MKQLAPLAAVYALVATLVLPGSLLASEDTDPATEERAAEPTPQLAEPAPAREEVAPEAEQPAAAPAEPQEPAAAAEQPAAAAAPPEQPAREREQRTVARAAASGSVTIADFQFAPAQITIDQGDTVTWTNDGPSAHSATASDGSFDTGIFPAGESRSHTFDEAGSFSYICTPHPNMHGTIVVRASQTGGDTPDSSAGESGGSSGTGSGAEAAQSDDGSSLPNTGADAGALLVLGTLMLLLGVAVHRRAGAAG
jgi:LPXTG-motif cell wall-anchored protein